MVLQKVKEKLYPGPTPASNTTMTNLCQSCKDAAKKSIRILRALQDSKEICECGGFPFPSLNDNF